MIDKYMIKTRVFQEIINKNEFIGIDIIDTHGTIEYFITTF